MVPRLVTAMAVLVSGIVHLQLWWSGGFREIAVVGPLFLLNAVAAAAIALATVAWRHWLPPAAAVAFGAATLGAFVTSATVGLFGVHERWVGAPVWVAAASEAIAVVGGVAALLTERRTSRVQLEQSATARGAHLD